MVANLPDLKYLYLRGCELVDDSVLKALGKNCPNLTVLDCTGCENVKDAGVAGLARGCHRLRKVFLDGKMGCGICPLVATEECVLLLSSSCCCQQAAPL